MRLYTRQGKLGEGRYTYVSSTNLPLTNLTNMIDYLTEASEQNERKPHGICPT